MKKLINYIKTSKLPAKIKPQEPNVLEALVAPQNSNLELKHIFN